MQQKMIAQPKRFPLWFDGKKIIEPIFCQDFLETNRLAYVDNAFFTPEGKLVNLNDLRSAIYWDLQMYSSTNVSKQIDSIVNLLKIQAQMDELPPQTDRIHVQNGTLFLDGTFSPDKKEIVRSRFPVAYNPDTKPPTLWLQFLSELLWPEDIPALQEFIGYCLIPCNAGQKMMLIKGSGGEGCLTGAADCGGSAGHDGEVVLHPVRESVHAG